MKLVTETTTTLELTREDLIEIIQQQLGISKSLECISTNIQTSETSNIKLVFKKVEDKQKPMIVTRSTLERADEFEDVGKYRG